MIRSSLFGDALAYVDGKWTGSDLNQLLPVVDPATGDRIAEVPDLGGTETTRAVEAAERALTAGMLSPEADSRRRRTAWLRAIAEALREHRSEFARLITLENGKPLAEAGGEVEYAAGFFHDASGRVEELAPRRLAERPRDLDWTVYARPAGVAALITPWNFPLAMIAKKLSAAIAAGAPSVTKPSEKTPLTMIALFALMDRLALPPGFVNLVIGQPDAIGQVLTSHPAVRVVSFTGSTRVGRLLAAQCAPHMKRLALELGGNAPFVVFQDADLAAAADQLVQNKFRAGGQTCVCANRVLVQREAMPAFSALMAERVARLVAGPGSTPGHDIGPMIDLSARAKVDRLVTDALSSGATVLARGTVRGDAARFYPPTVLGGITAAMACTREEIFGPVVALQEFRDEEEAITLANDTEYGLAAYLFTSNQDRLTRIPARLHFGHLGWNTGQGPTPEAPFGGMVQSGMGREGGLEGILEFVELQTLPFKP